MHIREATIDDVPRIVELAGHFIEGTRYAQFLTKQPELLARMAVEMIAGKGLIVLGEVDGQVVGMLAVVPYVDPMTGVPMVDETVWWVEPAYRSTRLGPKLLVAVEKWARQNGLLMCRMIAPHNSTVGAFYERFGYSPVETIYLKRLA
jgi:GNAT superfamily N-acetyltransferase